MKKSLESAKAAELWSPSEVCQFVAGVAIAAALIGALSVGLLKPSWKEGYKAAEKDFLEWKQDVRKDDDEVYARGKDSVKYEAARNGAGRYEIDPTSGEVCFKWLNACDCKEGCKCTK